VGLQSPKSPKLVIFGINLPVFAPNGSIPISDFYKIWREEVVPGPHAHANVFTVVTLKSGLTAPNRQKWYFLYKFAHKGKFWGSQKKFNIGAQLQTFLYAMTPKLF